MSIDFVTNQEIILAARRNLTQDIWDYLSGGAESETTMRRNRIAFESIGERLSNRSGNCQIRDDSSETSRSNMAAN